MEYKDLFLDFFHKIKEIVFMYELGDDGLPKKMLDINKPAEKHFGYTKEELLKIEPSEIWVVENKAENKWTHLTKDKRKIHVELETSIAQIEGKLIAVSVVINKIERDLKLIAENIIDLIRLINVDGTIEYATPSHKNFLGYLPEELVGKSYDFGVYPDDREKLKETFRQTLTEKKFVQGIFRRVHKNGTPIWFNCYMNPILNKEGKIEKVIISARDITKTVENEENMNKLAYYDSLTNLPNRQLFAKILKEELIESKKTKEKTAVLFFDVDNFKSINDTLGHSIGDKVLIETARRLKESIRDYDTVSRISGDEFTMVLPNISSRKDVENIMKRIVNKFSNSIIIENHKIFVTTSIGASLFPDDGENSELLLENADKAMYKAKKSGKNNFAFY